MLIVAVGFLVVGLFVAAAAYSGFAEFTVTVTIDRDCLERVARLTRRRLEPGGMFWRMQAERLLSAYLWSEGKTPENRRLVVCDVSRDDIDVAASWDND